MSGNWSPLADSSRPAQDESKDPTASCRVEDSDVEAIEMEAGPEEAEKAQVEQLNFKSSLEGQETAILKRSRDVTSDSKGVLPRNAARVRASNAEGGSGRKVSFADSLGQDAGRSKWQSGARAVNAEKQASLVVSASEHVPEIDDEPLSSSSRLRSGPRQREEGPGDGQASPGEIREEAEKVVPVQVGSHIIGSDQLNQLNLDLKVSDTFVGASDLDGKTTDGRQVLNHFLNSKQGAVDQRNLRMKKELEQVQAGTEYWTITEKQRKASPRKESPFKVSPQKYSFKDKNAITGMSAEKASGSRSPLQPSKLEEEINQAIEQHQFCGDRGTEPLDDFIERYKRKSNDPNANEPNQKRLQGLMMQLIYQQIVNQISESEDVPQTFRHNMVRWCSLIIRSPKIQEFHNQFSDELAHTIRLELQNSSKAFQHYLTQTPAPIGPREHKIAPHLGDSIKKHRQSLNPDSLSPRKLLSTDPIPPLNKSALKERLALDEGAFDHLYFRSSDVRAINKRNRQVDQELEKAKYNYRKREKEKRRRWMQLTGANKHLRPARRHRHASTGRWDDDYDSSDYEREVEEKRKKRMTAEEMADIEAACNARLRQKYAQYYQNEFQLRVKAEARQINELVDSIDENNCQFIKEIQDTENAIKRLEQEKDPGAALVPGIKIERLIRQMAEQDTFEPAQIQLWHDEVWKSLEEINAEIKSQERGYLIVYSALEQKYANHMKQVKETTNVRIEALESALIETKLQHRRDVDRITMEYEDHLARIWNRGLEKRRVDALIEKYDNGIVLANVRQARDVIRDFLHALKSKEAEIDKLNEKIKEQRKVISAHDSVVRDREAFYIEERKLRKYYQEELFMLVRNLKLFEGDKKKDKRFKAIVEQEDDLNYQRKIQVLMEKFDLRRVLIEHINKYFGQQQGIRKLKEHMKELQLLDADAAEGQDDADAQEEAEDRGLDAGPEGKEKSAKKGGKGKAKRPPKDKAAGGKDKGEKGADKKEKQQSPKKGKEKKQSPKKRATAKASELEDSPNLQVALQNMLAESIRMKFKAHVKKAFDDAANGVNERPVGEWDLQMPEQTDGAKMKALQDMNEMMDDLHAEGIADDFRLAQAKEISLMSQAQQDRLKHGIELPELNLEKIAQEEKPEAGPARSPGWSQLKDQGRDSKQSKQHKQPEARAFSRISKASKAQKKRKSSFNPNKMMQDTRRSGGPETDRAPTSLHRDESGSLSLRSRSSRGPGDRRQSYAPQQSTKKDHFNMQKKKRASAIHPFADGRDSGERVVRLELEKKQGKQRSSGSNRRQRKRVQEEAGSRRSRRRESFSQELREDLSIGSKRSGNRKPAARSISGNSDPSLAQHPNKQRTSIAITDVEQEQPKTAQDHEPGDAVGENRRRSSPRAPGLQREEVAKESTSKLAIVSQASKKSVRGGGAANAQLVYVQRQLNKLSIGKVIMQMKVKPRPKDQDDVGHDQSSTSYEKVSRHSAEDQDGAEEAVQEAAVAKMTAPIQTASQAQPEQAGSLRGVCLVQRELDRLQKENYSKLLAELAQAKEDDPDDYRMDASQISGLQKLFEAVLGQKLDFDDYQALFISDLEYFFEKLNGLIVKNCDFGPLHQFIKNEGIDSEEENMTDAQRQRTLTQNEKENKRVPFGNLFKPVFDRYGQLAGFEIRHELICLMYQSHEFSHKVLERTVKSCMFMNKLLRSGQGFDYSLKQTKAGEELDFNKLQDVGVQVNEREVMNNISKLAATIETPRTRIFNILKDHICKVMGRLSAERYTYYHSTLDGLRHDQICDYQLEDIFTNDYTCKDNEFVTIAEYLQSILDQVLLAIEQIEDDQKQSLKLEQLVELNQKYDRKNKLIKKDKAVGAHPVMHDRAVDTGVKLLACYAQDGTQIVKKSQNQLAADRVMEEEFSKTLELFDVFARQLRHFEEGDDPGDMNKDIKKDLMNIQANLSEEATREARSRDSRSLFSGNTLHEGNLKLDDILKLDTQQTEPEKDTTRNRSRIAFVVRQQQVRPDEARTSPIRKARAKSKQGQTRSQHNSTENEETSDQNAKEANEEHVKQSKQLRESLHDSIGVIKKKGTGSMQKKKDGRVKIKKQDMQANTGTNAGLVMERLGPEQHGLFLLQQKEMSFPVEAKDEADVKIPATEFMNLFDRARATQSTIQIHKERVSPQASSGRPSRSPRDPWRTTASIFKTTEIEKNLESPSKSFPSQASGVRMIDVQREFNKLLREKLTKIASKNRAVADQVNQLMNVEDKSVPGLGYSQHFGGFLEKQRSSELETHSNTRTNLIDQAKKKATRLALAQQFGTSELTTKDADQRAFAGLKKTCQGSMTQTADQFFNDSSLFGINAGGPRMLKNMSPDALFKELTPMDKKSSFVDQSAAGLSSASRKAQSHVFRLDDEKEDKSHRKSKPKIALHDMKTSPTYKFHQFQPISPQSELDSYVNADVSGASRDEIGTRPAHEDSITSPQQAKNLIRKMESARMSLDTCKNSFAESSVPSTILHSALSRDIAARKHKANQMVSQRQDLLAMDRRIVKLSNAKLSSRKHHLNHAILGKSTFGQEQRALPKALYSTLRHSVNYTSSIRRNGLPDQFFSLASPQDAKARRMAFPPATAATAGLSAADEGYSIYVAGQSANSATAASLRTSLKKQRERIARAHLNKQHFDDFKREVEMQKLTATTQRGQAGSVEMPEIGTGQATDRAEAAREMKELQDHILKSKEAQHLSLPPKLKAELHENRHRYLRGQQEVVPSKDGAPARREPPGRDGAERGSQADLSPATEYDRSHDPEKEMVRGWSQRINKKVAANGPEQALGATPRLPTADYPHEDESSVGSALNPGVFSDNRGSSNIRLKHFVRNGLKTAPSEKD